MVYSISKPYFFVVWLFIGVNAFDRYLRFVKPSYDNFVRPTAAHADIVRGVHLNLQTTWFMPNT